MFEAIQNINRENNTAYVNFLVSDVIVTSLSYDSITDRYVLSERLNPLIIPPNDLQIWINVIKNWLILVRKYITSSTEKVGEFSQRIRVRRSPDKVILSGNINDIDISAEWSGVNVEIEPRDELIMNYKELLIFLKSYTELLNNIRNF